MVTQGAESVELSKRPVVGHSRSLVAHEPVRQDDCRTNEAEAVGGQSAHIDGCRTPNEEGVPLEVPPDQPTPVSESYADYERITAARKAVAGAIVELTECDGATVYPISSWLVHLRLVLVELRQSDGSASDG